VTLFFLPILRYMLIHAFDVNFKQLFCLQRKRLKHTFKLKLQIRSFLQITSLSIEPPNWISRYTLIHAFDVNFKQPFCLQRKRLKHI